MGRITKKDEKLKANIESRRARVIENFFGLSDDVLLHLTSALKAKKPCGACTKGKSEEGKTIHIPGKAVDEVGLCAMCHGTYLTPDVAQRQWAVEMVQPLVAPNPKTSEAQPEKVSDLPDQTAKAANLSDAELDALRTQLEKALNKEALLEEDAGGK